MTYRWEPTTPLDRILKTGFKRMDEAVEGVIAQYTYEPFNDYLNAIREGNRRANEALSPLVDQMERDNQRLYNYRLSAMAERARVGGVGLHGVGDQNAHGSPLNLLGAAYRNAFGGGL